MRIAFLLHTFPLPTETFILNQMLGVLRAGHDLRIYAWYRGPDQAVHGDVHAHHLLDRCTFMPPVPRNRRQRVMSALQLLRLAPRGFRRGLQHMLNPFRYGKRALNLELFYKAATFLNAPPHDILHCQFGNIGADVAGLVRTGALPGKLVTSFRGHDASRLLRESPGLYRELFACGDAFLPVSQSLLRNLVQANCPPARTRVLHSGVDCTRFTFTGRSRADDEPYRILSIARLVAMKGIGDALHAVHRLKQEGIPVHYIIIGEGPLEADLRQLVTSYDLGECVAFTGPLPREEVVVAMDKAHCLLVPSVTPPNGEQEGIPNVLKEAVLCGLPVVATTHGGIPEVIEDQRSGLLVPEGDAAALAEALKDMRAHPKRWEDMTRHGRAHVEREFDMIALNRDLLSMYDELVGGTD